MQFELPKLPYSANALEPHISARTVSHHYEKHHQGYLDKLAKALDGRPEADLSLEQIVTSCQGGVFNSAAQVWNHNFYWASLTPDPMRVTDPELESLLQSSFGGLDEWKSVFAEAASGEFGSGWTWLGYNPQEGRLSVFSTTDALTPLLMSIEPLLTLDVWEHAYYLDYQQDRGAYIEAFVDSLVNWEWAAARLHEVRSAA